MRLRAWISEHIQKKIMYRERIIDAEFGEIFRGWDALLGKISRFRHC